MKEKREKEKREKQEGEKRKRKKREREKEKEREKMEECDVQIDSFRCLVLSRPLASISRNLLAISSSSCRE